LFFRDPVRKAIIRRKAEHFYPEQLPLHFNTSNEKNAVSRVLGGEDHHKFVWYKTTRRKQGLKKQNHRGGLSV